MGKPSPDVFRGAIAVQLLGLSSDAHEQIALWAFLDPLPFEEDWLRAALAADQADVPARRYRIHR